MKLNAKFYPLLCLIFGLAMIAAGIITLAAGDVVLTVTCYIGGTVVVMHGVFLGISAFAKKKSLSKDSVRSLFISSLFNICVGGMILLLPALNMMPVYIIFVIYIFINALIKLLDYNIDRKDNVPGRLKELVLFVFYAVFGILMVFVPTMGKTAFLVVAGIYCIIYGAFLLSDFVFQCMPSSFRRRFNRKMSLPMPVILDTLRPFAKLKSRRRKSILDPEGARAELKPYFPEGKESDTPPDMEVMIHVSEHGFGIMGHCDLCFEGEMLSYGSYDLTTTSLFGSIADGILVMGKKEPYIRFYVTSTPREIYGYGFRLTDEQKEAVRQEIKEIKESVYAWEPPLQQILKNDPDAKGEASEDWGSKLWNCTGADFFKFYSGKMKTYFVLTSNCVMMADRIVRKACSDITSPRQVLTPGGYYDYLEHLLAMNNSPVFCRTVYDRESTAGWKYTPRVPYSRPELEMRSETEANRRASERLGKKNDRKKIKKHRHGAN